jgi:hypothetical protein
MRDGPNCAALTRHPAPKPDRDSTDPDDLRARAARYRSLAETLIDLRVIAVVEACAHELELRAMSSGRTTLA